jgi:hypothetical protein
MARPRSRIRSARMKLRVGFFLVSVLLLIAACLRYATFSFQDRRTHSESTTTSTTLEKPEPVGPHPLDPVIELAKREYEAFQNNVVDYTAVMLKRERIGGKLGEENRIALKIINSRSSDTQKDIPLQVYLRFESPSSVRGREVIWVDGKNDGNMIAHEAGMFNLMSVTLPPDGSLAMLGNKYPITGIGMGNLYKKLIEKGERDRRLGDCEVTIRENERFDDRNVVFIEVKHPSKKAEFDFHIARIYLDTQRHLPLRYESYLWPVQPGEEPPLEEQYTYQEIQLNVGLAEIDFDSKNPKYQFP